MEAAAKADPDDLAAHYNLAILYRRLGLKEKAAEQAASFADQKDDPTASTYARWSALVRSRLSVSSTHTS